MNAVKKLKIIIIAEIIAIVLVWIFIFWFKANDKPIIVHDYSSFMTTQEVEEFNKQFSIYNREQSGAKLKTMLTELETHANIHRDECFKIPEIKLLIDEAILIERPDYSKKGKEDSVDLEIKNYIDEIRKAKILLNSNGKYYVKFNYSDNGMITGIIIEKM